MEMDRRDLYESIEKFLRLRKPGFQFVRVLYVEVPTGDFYLIHRGEIPSIGWPMKTYRVRLYSRRPLILVAVDGISDHPFDPITF